MKEISKSPFGSHVRLETRTVIHPLIVCLFLERLYLTERGPYVVREKRYVLLTHPISRYQKYIKHYCSNNNNSRETGQVYRTMGEEMTPYLFRINRGGAGDVYKHFVPNNALIARSLQQQSISCPDLPHNRPKCILFL